MTELAVREVEIGEIITRHLAPERLTRYWDLLMAENLKVNLVSRETSRADFDRMVAESLLPLDLIEGDFGSYLDIGSGGGLPSIIILLSGRVKGETLMVERTQKKTAALERMLADLNLQGKPIPRTFEEVPLDTRFDLITLRYVKLTPQLLRRILPALSPTGVFAYFSKPEFEVSGGTMTVIPYKISTDQFVKSLTLFRR
ncbi:MAG: class I SAM-dependent methyltransferase [bacterium]|nr:class I SAM-dependent methyltransferase [bacterium]